MSVKKTDRLAHYFKRLPNPVLNKLTLALELDRLKDEDRGLPYDTLLGILRPFVAQSDNPVPRVPTPMRLFCDPFEDLLYNGKNPNKQPGRIIRPSLTPVWRWLSDELIPDNMQEIDVELRGHILKGNRGGVEQCLSRLHKMTGLALSDALKSLNEGTRSYDEIARKLGGQRAIEDARDMAIALRSARHLREIRSSFGHGIVDLDRATKEQAKDFFQMLQGWSADGADMVLFTLMNRMKEPWLILPLAHELDGEDHSNMSSRSVLAKTVHILADDFEQLAQYFEGLDLDNANMEEVVKDLTTFSHLGESLEQEISLASATAWSSEVDRKRSEVSQIIESHLERAPEAILDALPTLSLGTFGSHGSARPDISYWPDEKKSARAVSEAAFIDGLKSIANNAEFNAVYSDVHERLELSIEAYAQSIIQTIRATDGEEREKAEAYFETALTLTRQISGDDQANLLKNRVETAIAGDQFYSATGS